MNGDDWKGRFAAAIAESGKSQREISLAAGLGPGYLHSILAEGKEPTLQNVLKICAAADVSIVRVLGGFDMTPDTEELLRRATAADETVRQSLLHLLELRKNHEENQEPQGESPNSPDPKRP